MCASYKKQTTPELQRSFFVKFKLIGNTRRWLVACARLCLAWLSAPLAFVAFAYRFFIYARSSLARVYPKQKSRVAPASLLWYTHRESNPNLRLRRPPFYPLYYECSALLLYRFSAVKSRKMAGERVKRLIAGMNLLTKKRRDGK